MDASGIQERLIETTLEAKSVDLRPYEGWESERILNDLRPRVLEVLQEATILLDEVTTTFEESSGAESSGAERTATNEGASGHAFLHELDTLVEAAGDFGMIADIAFISAGELRRRREAVEGLSSSRDGWEVIDELGSALRKVIKAFTAVESTVCEQTGLPPQLGYATELYRSLEVRRAYAKFRDEITSGGEPGPEEVGERLRGVAVSIAKLTGRDIYPELRIGDRVQLRQLQERALEWLQAPDTDPGSGIRLWQDCAAYAALLRQVNHREELQQHDREIINELLTALTHADSGLERISGDFLSKARSLYGKDSDLDQLIHRGTEAPPSEWQAVLQGLPASGQETSGFPAG